MLAGNRRTIDRGCHLNIVAAFERIPIAYHQSAGTAFGVRYLALEPHNIVKVEPHPLTFRIGAPFASMVRNQPRRFRDLCWLMRTPAPGPQEQCPRNAAR
jgi:hypothetical protein